jgi:hypothetical protein
MDDRRAQPESAKPKPYERLQKLRLGVRIVWWSAVFLAVFFACVALWLGLVKKDLFALVYAILSISCAAAGYGMLLAVRRPSTS